MAYKTLVVAVDMSGDAKTIVSKAVAILNANSGELHLIHVIEPIPVSEGYDLNPALPVEWENILVQRAEDFLSQLVQDMGDVNIKTSVRIGSIRGEIFSLVKVVKADLIVVGTHGQHGLALLLGSTASSVMHGTPCDVLAVDRKSVV